MLYRKFIGKILLSALMLVALAGCETEEGAGDDFLALTIGDTTYRSNTSQTVNIEDGTTFITTVKASEGAEITLGGDDSELFDLSDDGLFFRTKVNAWYPSDMNEDGDYELIITASRGEEIITYTVTYHLPVALSAKELLAGKSFWVEEDGENEFYFLTFNDDTFDYKHYVDYDVTEKEYSGIKITYSEDTYSYISDNKTVTCTLKEESPLTFECTNGSTTLTRIYLDKKPAFVIPESWKVSAVDDQIHNTHDEDDDGGYKVPRITSMTVSGNHEKDDDGKAVVILDGENENKFTVEGEIDNIYYLRSLTIMLKNGADGVKRTFSSTPDTTQTFDCVFNSMDAGDVASINYTCNGVTIDDTTAEDDTTIEMYACDTKDPLDAAAKCNWAEVPVLFYE